MVCLSLEGNLVRNNNNNNDDDDDDDDDDTLVRRSEPLVIPRLFLIF